MALLRTAATLFLRNLGGGSQSKLIVGEDDQIYVVKFKNNPQGIGSIVNEALGILIAREMELPVPEIALMDVSKSFILANNLTFYSDEGKCYCDSGFQLAIKLAVHPARGRIFDVSDMDGARTTDNAEVLDFAQIFDWWTCNIDRRQLVVWRASRQKKFRLSMIDFGYCFGGPEHDWRKIPSCNNLNLTPTSIEWCNQLELWDCSKVRGLLSEIADLIPSALDLYEPFVKNLEYRKQKLTKLMKCRRLLETVRHGDSKKKCKGRNKVAGSARLGTLSALPTRA
jgi:hypothetical protein